MPMARRHLKPRVGGKTCSPIPRRRDRSSVWIAWAGEAGREAANGGRSDSHRIPLKAALRQFIFRILGKDPEAIVVSFASGDADLGRQMFAEIQQLEPARRHVLVTTDELEPGSSFKIYLQLRRRFRRQRIGLAPVLFTNDQQYRALRRAAFLLAPTKIDRKST